MGFINTEINPHLQLDTTNKEMKIYNQLFHNKKQNHRKIRRYQSETSNGV